nr:hypothetical protein [Tanacetum cinerariifolium]
MLLLLVSKNLSNLERDDLFDLNVALRMFTRRVVILKRVEDLHLGVESYQKKLNLTRHKTFRVLHDIASNLEMDYFLKRRWSKLDRKRSRIMIKAIDQQPLKEGSVPGWWEFRDPKGVIYKDQNEQNRLMRADKLHKSSDGTLIDVRTAFNDIAKGIRMEYLPKRKWSGLDKRRARDKDGISAKEEMEWFRQMKGSGYGSGYRQATLREEVDAEFREVCWWKRLRE